MVYVPNFTRVMFFPIWKLNTDRTLLKRLMNISMVCQYLQKNLNNSVVNCAEKKTKNGGSPERVSFSLSTLQIIVEELNRMIFGHFRVEIEVNSPARYVKDPLWSFGHTFWGEGGNV